MKRKIDKLRHIAYTIIFEADTFWGKRFDEILMLCIIASVFITIFDSMLTTPWMITTLVVLEYLFTVVFTAEYALRLWCSPRPRAYAVSFFGIVDLVSILPMYMAIFFGPARFMIIVRVFRLIRVFRVFKLFNFLAEGNLLLRSLQASRNKILVYFMFVLVLVVSLGTIMYIVEGNQPGSPYTDVPTSIYWAIVTLTTVGYGDIAPITAVGRLISAFVMMMGYTIIAVPTGIVSASMISESNKTNTRSCPNCGKNNHAADAKFCSRCGAEL